MARKASRLDLLTGDWVPEKDSGVKKEEKKKTQVSSLISRPFTPEELFSEIRRLRKELALLLKTKKKLTS